MRLLLIPLLLALTPRAATASDRPAARAGAGEPIVVTGSRVRFADLSPTAPHDLAELDVAPAPAPGETVVISRLAVQAALRRGGADPHLADGLPAYHRVRRASTELTPQELRARIQQAVAPRLPVGVYVEEVVGLSAVQVPVGPVDVAVEFGRLRRATAATVTVRASGAAYRRMNVTLKLGGTPRAPRLRRDLPRGAVVRGVDVELAPTALDKLPARAATRPEHLVGRQLVQPQRAGRPIARSATRKPPTVTRGNTVDLVASSGGLRISRRVVVQEPGHVGDTVRVRPVDGKSTIVARVISSREVRVDLGGAP